MQQFWRCGQIPIRIGDMIMAKIGRQLGQVSLDIDATAIPFQECFDGESVTEIVQAGTS
jgi:hypothetical protein